MDNKQFETICQKLSNEWLEGKMTEDIKKIREMLGFLVKQKVSERLNKLNADEKRVYDLTGNEKRDSIKTKTGFAAGKISKIWQRLEDEGLLIKEGKGYRKVV